MRLGAPFNPGKAMYISVASSGTVYTTDLTKGFANESIARAKFLDGRYGDYETIGPPVSIGKSDMYPNIAPDESYLIFSSKRIDEGDGSHMFVTTPDGEGGWGRPRLIDTGFDANNMAFVTFDKKYLFFTSAGDIYWVSAHIIED
jgi:hypothetical protein